jgi:hypothetical protein
MTTSSHTASWCKIILGAFAGAALVSAVTWAAGEAEQGTESPIGDKFRRLNSEPTTSAARRTASLPKTWSVRRVL